MSIQNPLLKLASVLFPMFAAMGLVAKFMPPDKDTCVFEARNNGGGVYSTRCHGGCDASEGSCTKTTNPLTGDQKCLCKPDSGAGVTPQTPCDGHWNVGAPPANCDSVTCGQACTPTPAGGFPVGVWVGVCKC